MSEKLQKILAQAGLGSRREMERWIEQGRVSINGRIVTIGQRIDEHDKIRVDGKLIKNPMRKARKIEVLMYHKPEGVLCSKVDDKNRPTVFERLPRLNYGRWIMVGRLDINTSGLLLFTNHGELANRLMHPKYNVEREYAVRVFGEVSNQVLNLLTQGVELEDGFAKFDALHFSGGTGLNRWYHVTLHEGRNREVRRLWESQGIRVSRLTRVRYGSIQLPRYLRIGQYKKLTDEEINPLLQLVEL